MTKLRQILRLHIEGKSKSEIAHLTGGSRNTVKRYLRILEREQLNWQQIEAMNNHQLSMIFCMEYTADKSARYKELDPLMPDILKQLRRKGVTRTRVWKEFYLKHYPDGFRFTQFSRYINLYLNKTSVSMHIEHKAGDKMYIDFAGEKIKVLDPDTAELYEYEVFIAVLGCSQLAYVEAVRSQTRADLIRACENALHYFGGVPALIVPDNLKSAVTKSSKYEPTINELFNDFALHYGTTVLPTRTYRPKDKSLVEGMVNISYQRIYAVLEEHLHCSLDDLNKLIRPLNDEINTTRMSGRDYSRRDAFEQQEQALLRPLPMHRYELRKQRFANVMKTGHVQLLENKNYYSVPYTLMGEKVKILYDDRTVDIYHHFNCVATHRRSFKPYHHQTDKEHLASTHRYLADWSVEKFVSDGNAIHPDVGAYLHAVIESKQHPEQGYRSCQGILKLLGKVGRERLINACKRGTEFESFGYNKILSILDKKLDQALPYEQKSDQPIPAHHNLRGSGYYK